MPKRLFIRIFQRFFNYFNQQKVRTLLGPGPGLTSLEANSRFVGKTVEVFVVVDVAQGGGGRRGRGAGFRLRF